MMKEDWIKKLNLIPHPEGGYYKETYRSSVSEEFNGFEGKRNACTSIYFMLTKGNFSAFHKIKSDEMWHFYDGDSISIFVLTVEGEIEEIKLGLNFENGETPQAVVPAGAWFASRVSGVGEFALVGCTVAPGFDFQDFELANRQELLSQYPKHAELITELTRVE